MTETRRRAFVVTSNQNVDLTAVLEHGDIVMIFDKSKGVKLGSPFDLDSICRVIRQRMRELCFDPTVDYVVVYGSFIYMSCLAAVIAVDYGTIHMLLFDSPNSRYVPRRIDFTGRTRHLPSHLQQ